ncbi:MAG: hypothetical protein HZB59_06830 [Ignavibacteriales bacterium]|nr:hypothetical protein [Ignavibacteriales bacterium]
MAVGPDLSRAIIQEELSQIKDIARTLRWGIVPDYNSLKVIVTMFSHTGDLFIVSLLCDDYKEKPPFIEFIDPETGEPGTNYAYPKSIDSFFHSSGPCICAPFSRKAYKSVVQSGPHEDWPLNADWVKSTASNIQWANHSKLGDMLGTIYSRISLPDYYKGRMG